MLTVLDRHLRNQQSKCATRGDLRHRTKEITPEKKDKMQGFHLKSFLKRGPRSHYVYYR
jgi:hypothetical protein